MQKKYVKKTLTYLKAFAPAAPLSGQKKYVKKKL